MVGQFISEIVGDVVIQTLLDSSDATVDLWAQDVHKQMQADDETKMVRLLIDVGQPNVVFTEYARQISTTIFTDYKHRVGKFAMLFEWKTGPHIARLFIASLGKMTLTIAFFNDKDEAMRWLQATIDL